jgi:hypothetical protein
MAKKVTVSVQPTKQRPNTAQRRAHRGFSTTQAELKREAAERRAKRALNGNAPEASTPREARQPRGAATLADRPTTSRG